MSFDTHEQTNGLEVLANVLCSCANQRSKLELCDTDAPDTPIFKADTLEDSGSGFGYLFYKNNSSDTTLSQNVTLKLQGIQPLIAPKQRNFSSSIVEEASNTFKVTIAPKDEGIIVLRTFGESFSYGMSYTTQYIQALDDDQIMDIIKQNGKSKALKGSSGEIPVM